MVHLEMGGIRTLELELELVRNEGNEFGVGGFSFGVADGVAEESLEGVQVTPVPGHFNGVPDGPLYTGRRGLEGFGHLWIEHLGDGIDDIHVVDGDDDGLPQVLIALDVGRHADFMDDAGDQRLYVGPVFPDGYFSAAASAARISSRRSTRAVVSQGLSIR